MKKFLSLVLVAIMLMSCASIAFAEADADLVAAAKAEGELVVYGSCEEPYLAAFCQHFEKMSCIKTQF